MNTAQVDSEALDRNAPDEPEVLALVDGPAPDRAAWVAARHGSTTMNTLVALVAVAVSPKPFCIGMLML